MTYIYSTKITRSKWIYRTISQDQKGILVLQFGMGHCVADFTQTLLAYVIVQNYTPGGVGSNFSYFSNSGNFEFSRSEQTRALRKLANDHRRFTSESAQ
jgi:hypothetical protein